MKEKKLCIIIECPNCKKEIGFFRKEITGIEFKKVYEKEVSKS